VTRGCSRSSRR